jgi:methylase of polypeptide subunit release factors
MEGTRETLVDNGVNSEKLFTYEVSESSLQEIQSNKFDVIISLLSCGWHYSIENYIDLIKKSLNKDGVVILDIRHNTGQLEYALEHFTLVNQVINIAESKHTGGTIGDRYIFKLK